MSLSDLEFLLMVTTMGVAVAAVGFAMYLMIGLWVSVNLWRFGYSVSESLKIGMRWSK